MSSKQLRGFATQPETPGSRYTPEETVRLQEMFRPQAHLFRRRQRQALTAFLVGSVPFFGSLLLNRFCDFLFDRMPVPQSFATPLGALAAVSLVISIGFLWSLPTLRCPACKSFLNRGISRHCPECGSDQLEPNIFGNLCCKTCGKDLESRRNKGRSYRIHACTGCGLMLDYRGL